MKYKSFSSAVVIVLLAVIAISSSSCKKFLGLNRQTSYTHNPDTVNARFNFDAWEMIKQRGAPGSTDTLFRRMYEGILYSEIDTNEFKRPGRTFIILHNDAIVRRNASGTLQTDCFWGRYRIGTQNVTTWSYFPKETVKNWFLSLIVDGEYHFYNLNNDNVFAKTLLPTGTDANNPESLMALKLSNDRDTRLRINDFPGTARLTTVRTGGYFLTNGSAHVVDRLVEYRVL